MRTIKFRGKIKKDNTWVFGTYHCSNDGKYHYILAKEKIKTVSLSPSQIFGALHDKEVFDVNPKTVGQFTGLIDKKGKEIYEGDYLKKYSNMIWEVKFVNGKWIALDISQDSDLEIQPELFISCEIIGNKHDNPEIW